MSLTKNYLTDESKEIDGIEIKMPANDDGTIPTFVVGRSGGRTNKRYTKALETEMKPYAGLQRLKQLKNELAEKLLIAAFCKGAMVTWHNIPMADVTGNDSDKGYAPFTVENAEALFTRLPELYTDLQTQSNDVSLFRAAEIEENVKN